MSTSWVLRLKSYDIHGDPDRLHAEKNKPPINAAGDRALHTSEYWPSSAFIGG